MSCTGKKRKKGERTDDIAGHKESHHSDINSLREERNRLMESLKLTVNHVARLERLLGFLTPEEQLIIAVSIVGLIFLYYLGILIAAYI